MSILITGMEIPTIEMEWTIRYGADGKWYAIDTNAETSDGEWHEIIPVPPHGRLIDVDYADDYAYDELEVANSYLTGWEAARAMQKIYRNAPTIIPASEEGEA